MTNTRQSGQQSDQQRSENTDHSKGSDNSQNQNNSGMKGEKGGRSRADQTADRGTEAGKETDAGMNDSSQLGVDTTGW